MHLITTKLTTNYNTTYTRSFSQFFGGGVGLGFAKENEWQGEEGEGKEMIIASWIFRHLSESWRLSITEYLSLKRTPIYAKPEFHKPFS
jgi:hypothetical protein